MANAATVASLRSARDNLAALIEAKTAEWVATGCPPSFSVDGESYEWSSWLADKTKAIDDLTAAIQRLSTPWIVRTRGRA